MQNNSFPGTSGSPAGLGPEAPTLFIRGRRIPVGEARLLGDYWAWWRRVRKTQKGRWQAHWWHDRGGWVIGCHLLDQVRPWATWTVYEDEDRNEWWISTEEIPKVGERIEIGGAPHWFVAERCWDHKPPAKPEAVQVPLWGAAGHE